MTYTGCGRGDQAFQRLGQGVSGVETERHRADRRFHDRGWEAVQAVNLGCEKAVSPRRGRHREEARLRQRQQRHLPRHSAVPVGVVMELVHDDVLTRAEGPSRRAMLWDLGRAADDGAS